MSQKKHKNDHAGRAERRAAEKKALATQSTPAEKTRRVYLRNSLYITLTLLVILGVLGVLILLWWMRWWDNPIGSIVSVLIGAFGCMCIYDIGLLMTACISFGEGMVNAGKNAEGHLMVFHASSVERLEMRDKDDHPLPDDLPLYRNAELVFVMSSGRVDRRKFSRLTAKQYAKLQEALEAERHAEGLSD